MGASSSCCRPRRTSQIGIQNNTVEEQQQQNEKQRRSSSFSQQLHGSLSALIPGMGKHISSSSLVYGNHLTLPSSTLQVIHHNNNTSNNTTAQQQQIDINEDGFHFHHLIDTGGFGFVFKATRKTTGKTYALKVQPMEFMSRLTRSAASGGGHRSKANEVSLQMEKTALAACRGHPFIVSLEYSFHTPLYAILALEYIPGGTLTRLISHSPMSRLPCDLARIYTAELALALNFMHEKGIIYRDVKPSNILIDLDGHCKVTDFGLAGSMLMKKKQPSFNPQENSIVVVDVDSEEENENKTTNDRGEEHSDSSSSSSSSVSSEEPEWLSEDDEDQTRDTDDDVKGSLYRVRRRTLCGTAGYRPPEQVGERYVDYANRNGYDERVDYFSLGVTVFLMVCGQRPFPTRRQMMLSDNELLKQSGGVSSPSRRRSSISDHNNHSSAIQRAATRKLMKDVEFKCLMTEVKFPDFLENDIQAKSFIEQLLAKDPNNRPRFNGIKDHSWMSSVDFDAAKLKESKLPYDWVQKHAMAESKSKPRSMRRASMTSQHKAKTDLSVTLFIEDICAQMIEIGRDQDAEEAAARWMAVPSSKTEALFRHWNYISDDALRLEVDAAANNSSSGHISGSTSSTKFPSRRKMRRATQ